VALLDDTDAVVKKAAARLREGTGDASDTGSSEALQRVLDQITRSKGSASQLQWTRAPVRALHTAPLRCHSRLTFWSPSYAQAGCAQRLSRTLKPLAREAMREV
jgi:hypothetical protein